MVLPSCCLLCLMGKGASDKMMLLWSWNLCDALFYVSSRWPHAYSVIWPFASLTCLLLYCRYELFYRNIKCELLSPSSTTIIHSSNKYWIKVWFASGTVPSTEQYQGLFPNRWTRHRGFHLSSDLNEPTRSPHFFLLQ